MSRVLTQDLSYGLFDSAEVVQLYRPLPFDIVFAQAQPTRGELCERVRLRWNHLPIELHNRLRDLVHEPAPEALLHLCATRSPKRDPVQAGKEAELPHAARIVQLPDRHR